MKTDFAKHIRDAGEKATGARVAVLSALARFHEPISIKALGKSVKGHDTSTLYRTLETLVAAGLAKKVAIDPSEALYEATIGRPHHHHIVCTSCGLIEAVDVCAPLPSKKSLSAKGFSAITDHNLEFFGICSSCV